MWLLQPLSHPITPTMAAVGGGAGLPLTQEESVTAFTTHTGLTSSSPQEMMCRVPRALAGPPAGGWASHSAFNIALRAV